MHFETSIVVSIPRARAYDAFTDFESMPKWSKQVTAVRVLKRDGDTVHVVAESASGKGPRTAHTVMRLFPPDRVESSGETRYTRTTRAVVFEEVQGGTKLTATLDVRVKGVWRFLLTESSGEGAAEESVVDELASFGRYLEGLSPDPMLGS